jgi:hypothetical protein
LVQVGYVSNWDFPQFLALHDSKIRGMFFLSAEADVPLPPFTRLLSITGEAYCRIVLHYIELCFLLSAITLEFLVDEFNGALERATTLSQVSLSYHIQKYTV